MSDTICLIPDTMFFIQCRSINELDWTAWEQYDEIHLVVCRPVQREIDKFKNYGNSRTGRRARKTSSIFKSIISGENDFHVLSETTPHIKLYLDMYNKPDPELIDLDYSQTDDQIVGICANIRNKNPDKEFILLTNDTGPLGTAKALNLPFFHIPDRWLLKTESNVTERENRKLKAAIVRIRNTEPKFRITWQDCDKRTDESLWYEYRYSKTPTECEIEKFEGILRSKFPLHTFDDSLITGLYESPSKEDIDRYVSEYGKWISECKGAMHRLLTAKDDLVIHSFCIGASNEGSRPAKDALATVTARGDFEISPPQDEIGTYPEEVILTQPPNPPKWRKKPAFWIMESMTKGTSIIEELHGKQLFSPNVESQRDSNRFYYKQKPNIPTRSFSLECDQWRHSSGEIQFCGRIYHSRNAGNVNGKLEIVIHAENLSDPVRKFIPVSITALKVSPTRFLQALMEKLTATDCTGI